MSFAEDYRNTIMWKIDSLVARLNGAAIDLTQLALLVSDDGWTDLETHIKQYSHITGYESFEAPLTEITYRGIEVRKR